LSKFIQLKKMDLKSHFYHIKKKMS
ncbi:hypothetical protein, partial [Acinetobacter baumannii]